MPKIREPIEDVYKIYDFQYPVLKIPVDHAPDLVIGLRKARTIMQHLDAIRAFILRHEIAGHAVEQMAEPEISGDP